MSQLAQEYADQGLVVLAVNAWDEPAATLRKFAADQKLRQRILLNGSGVAERFGVESVPSTYFIDRSGIVQAYQIGANSKALRTKTSALIGGSSP